MITIQSEGFAQNFIEFEALTRSHWEALALFKTDMPLDPNWEEYVLREMNGSLQFFTVRQNGKMVGYYVALISPGLHYKSTLCAHMDIMWIVNELRGQGWGIKLFAFVENELKKRGVKVWYSGYKTHNSFEMDRVLKHFKFKAADTYMVKWIGT